MGLLKKLFGKSTTQNTASTGTSNINSTTQRTNPDWLTNLTQDLAGDIGGLRAQPGNFYTGADPLQAKAYAGAAALGAMPGYGGVSDGQSQGFLDGIGGAPFNLDDSVHSTAPPGDPQAALAALGIGPNGTSLDTPLQDPGVTSGMKAGTFQDGDSVTMGYGSGPGAAVPASTGDPFADAANITKAAVGQGPNTFEAASYKPASVLDNYDAIFAKLAPSYQAALADFDKSAGDTRAQLDLSEAGSGAFQNSGNALERASVAGELARGRARVGEDQRTQARTLAAQLSAGDAGLAQQAAAGNAGALQAARQFNAGAGDRARGLDLDAAGQLANIAQAFGGESRANVGTQASLGQVFRDITAGGKTADADKLAMLEQLFSGLPLDQFGGQTTNGTTTTSGTSKTKRVDSGSLADNIQQALQIAAAAAALGGGSDRNFKDEIVRIGTHGSGLPLYAFRCLWDGVRRIGVMAQDVLKVKPQAVTRLAVEGLPDGFLFVDYGRL